MLAKAQIHTHRSTNDFSRLLGNHTFKSYGQQYLLVGNIKGSGGWAINVSIIKSQIAQALKTIVPEIIREKVAFKIIRDLTSAELVLTAAVGYDQVGKIICIFPENEQRSLHLAKLLIDLTAPFRGPAIPTDAHLGACVYTSYGSYETTEEYPIPFQMPRGMSWPFSDITAPTVKQSNILHQAYLVRSVIKSDAKGRVLKGLWVKGLRFRSVIIKEGVHDMFIDGHDRDIQERVAWQYEILRRLWRELPTPEPFELFKEDGNTYLSMEAVEGVPLHDAISEIYKDQRWPYLDVNQREQLLDYLNQLLDIVSRLHAAGYIHRDISPANFMVNKRGRLVMIDLELAYSQKDNQPDPPFDSGINGFTAPERLTTALPSVSEDIYSLGAVISIIFTNFYPAKGYANSLSQLEKNLKFMIGDDSIVELIVQCLQSAPENRPSINQVQAFFKSYSPENNHQVANINDDFINPKDAEQAITKGMDALATPLMTNENRLWITNLEEEKRHVENSQKRQIVQIGFHSGIAGVAYVIAKAKELGYSLSKISAAWTENYKHLLVASQKAISTQDASLYTGSSGIALALSAGIRSGLLHPNGEVKRTLVKCLNCETSGLSLATGAAGQGIALLNYLALFDDAEMEQKLQNVHSNLTAAQNRDGSWTKDGNRFTGLARGTSGIVLFLLSYYSRFPNSTTERAIKTALDRLIKQSKKRNNAPVWLVSDTDRRIDPWLENGLTGIAIAFMRAYKTFGVKRYDEISQSILETHPPFLSSNNLGIANGLAGIGHAYLEAGVIFNDDQWVVRARRLANVILNSKYIQHDGSFYWAIENRRPPTPGFMNGSAGIIHYLMRIAAPEPTSFPL